MFKTRFISMLALLLTAATGAWATDVYVVGNGNVDDNWVNGAIWDPGVAGNKMTEQNGVYSITFTNVDANSELLFKFAIDGSWDVNYGCTSTDANELNKTLSNIDATGGMNFAFALTEKADVTISFNLSELTYMISTKGMKVGDDAATTYTVSLKDGVKDADKWTVKVGEGQAQALPIDGLKGDGSETVTLQYTGRLKVKGVKATSDAAAAVSYDQTVSINDGAVTVTAGEHWLITGTGEATSNKITISDGATVTLDGVNISGISYCIKCNGSATIILKDGSENTLTSTDEEYPALSIGDAGTTLTIQGSTGVLNVTSGMYCAGIGGGYKNTNSTCGNIRIEGGVITAQGGSAGAGIGSDCGPATCGDIIITGGTITAIGGNSATGIGNGSGYSDPVVCGDITIANTVTKVTATKGTNAPHSIGMGNSNNSATCGTVTIGGTKYWENNAAVNGGDTYLATSPLIYDPSN